MIFGPARPTDVMRSGYRHADFASPAAAGQARRFVPFNGPCAYIRLGEARSHPRRLDVEHRSSGQPLPRARQGASTLRAHEPDATIGWGVRSSSLVAIHGGPPALPRVRRQGHLQVERLSSVLGALGAVDRRQQAGGIDLTLEPLEQGPARWLRARRAVLGLSPDRCAAIRAMRTRRWQSASVMSGALGASDDSVPS